MVSIAPAAWAWWRGRADSLRYPHLPELSAERLLRNGYLELIGQPLHQIDYTPSHHAVDGRHRPVFDCPGQGGPVHFGQDWLRPRAFIVDQRIGAARVQLQHPISHDLKCHTAHSRGIRPARAIVDRGQSQQTPGLPSIPALASS